MDSPSVGNRSVSLPAEAAARRPASMPCLVQGDSATGEGHHGQMASSPGRYAIRRQEILDRLTTIQNRLDALRCRPDHPSSLEESLEAADATAAAEERAALAVAASLRALHLSAEAHERAALVHDRAIAHGQGDVSEHQRRADQHRAAAIADESRAAG